ncbi:hypothetical protein [Labrenzia sp. OB1]|uniref:hypothetical protein n=1 Tax=Labrenzia sp. OB1 TaxID=1561204 RepID=UPI000838EEF8|nr:hypothetical protein [Labrenzia sp. OB1]
MTWLDWDSGRARLARCGAKLAELEVDLPDGRRVAPLHKAPWLGEDLPGNIPPLLAGLSGEWPCVPFGMAPKEPLAGDWSGLSPLPDPWPHGFAANHDWEISSAGSHALQAKITYPESDPVHHLTRQVRGVSGKAAVEISLGIHMRREASLPIGVHPVFRLPPETGQARLCPGDHDQVYCYPADTGGMPAFSRSAPFRIEDLTGLGFDPLALPYPERSETLLLLTGSDGRFSLENHVENYRVTLNWEPEVFPSLLLWISNGGRSAAPWNGRHWALGVEPVCAAFDLGTSVSAADNPLQRAGVRTVRTLTPDHPFTTNYSISVAAL